MPIQAGLLNQFNPADGAGVLAQFNPTQAYMAGSALRQQQQQAAMQGRQQQLSLQEQQRQALIDEALAQAQFEQGASDDQIKNEMAQKRLELEQTNSLQAMELANKRFDLDVRQQSATELYQQANLGLAERKFSSDELNDLRAAALAERGLKLDEAYKGALIEAQRFSNDPSSAENLLKMVNLQKSIKDLNSPLSPEGKLAYDVQNNPELAGQIQQGTTAGKAPQGYRFKDPMDPNSELVPIPGGPAGQGSLNPNQAAVAAALQEAMADFKKAKDILFDKDGDVNDWDVLWQGIGRTDGNNMRKAMQRAIMTKVRLESGAAITPDELERYETSFLPSMTDSDQAIKDKIKNFEGFLKTTSSLIQHEPSGGMLPTDVAAAGINAASTAAPRMPPVKSILVPPSVLALNSPVQIAKSFPDGDEVARTV